MEVCQRCGGTDVEYESQGAICAACGNVIDGFVTGPSAALEGRLITDTYGQAFAGVAPGSNSRLALDRTRALERDTAAMLNALQLQQRHLPARCADICRLARACQAPGSPPITARALAGAAVCVACREERLPLLLADAADAFGCSRFTLGAVLKRVLEETQLVVPPPDLGAYLAWAAWRLLPSEPRREALVRVASAFLDWLHNLDFAGGRPTPFCLVACAFRLSCEGLQVACTDQGVSGAFRLHHKTLQRAASQARRQLLGLAAVFPWFGGLTEKTVASRGLQLLQADSLRRVAQAQGGAQPAAAPALEQPAAAPALEAPAAVSAPEQPAAVPALGAPAEAAASGADKRQPKRRRVGDSAS